MAGVISPSMWVYELRDEVHDNTSWCSLNEGLGKVLRYGAYGPEVIERLRWMNTVLGADPQVRPLLAGSRAGASRTSPTTKGRGPIHNASLLVAAIARRGRAEDALPALRYSLQRQRPDGSWPSGRAQISGGWTATTPPSSSGACSGP